MNFILFITLFIKTFSISIPSNYAIFHNFTEKNKSLDINFSCNKSDENIMYNISYYNNSDLNDNVTCKINLTCSEDFFTCNFTKSGTFSLIIENNERNKIYFYKNLITIYNYSNKYDITNGTNKNCFIFNKNITNKNLLNIKFEQIINKSLVNFILYNETGKINATPYIINNESTIIGVENVTFYNNTYYHLNITTQDDILTFENVLNFSNFKNYETDYPNIENFLNGKSTLTKLETNCTYDKNSKLRIKFSKFEKDKKDYFDIPPQIIYPNVNKNIEYDENNNENNEKYQNTYKFTLATSSMTGQVILEYQYCGNYTINYTDIYIEENIYKKYGLDDSSSIFKINKFLIYIIIILFI